MMSINTLIRISLQKARKTNIGLALVMLFALSSTTFAQGNNIASPTLPQSEIDRIITTFTNKELQFRKALLEYSFTRDALLQSLGMGGQVTGEYHLNRHHCNQSMLPGFFIKLGRKVPVAGTCLNKQGCNSHQKKRLEPHNLNFSFPSANI